MASLKAVGTLQADFANRETLWDRYPIRYRNPSRVPVQLIIRGNRLLIRIFIRYAANMLDLFPGTNLTYADIAESGIRKNWSGRFELPWLKDDGFERAHARASARVLTESANPDDNSLFPNAPSIRVCVEIIRQGNRIFEKNYPKQRCVKIRLSNGFLLPAHVSSPLWRWGWGFLGNFQFEATSLNWSVRHPGDVTLHKEANRYLFEQISAHEMGHVLGLGDAYGANYRFFYEAPGTSDYMMCHNRKVQPDEIERMLLAHMTNRMQYFPRRFDWRIFSTGFRREFKLQFNTISKRAKH